MSHRAIQPSAVYELSQNLTDLPESLRLRSLEWGILFSITGRHTVAQIGELLGVAPALRDVAFGRLLEHGLLRERELSYGEYLRASAADGDDREKSLSQFLRAGAAWSGAADRTAVVDPPPIPEASAGALGQPRAPQGEVTGKVSLQDMAAPGYDPTVTRAVPTVSREEALAFRPLESPASSPSEPPPSPGGETAAPTDDAAKRMSLRALMSFILDRAPDLNSGRLDIYRVFIRVDTKLLKRNGINTLRFEEDRQVEDPELQEAIVASLQSTLGLACPQQVYV